MGQRTSVFRCTWAQAVLALSATCMVLAGLILFSIANFQVYQGRAFFPGPADSKGYVPVEYVMFYGQQAGLKVGDQIIWRSLDLNSRLVFTFNRFAVPGKTIVYPVLRGNRQLNLSRTPRREDTLPTGQSFSTMLQIFVASVVIVVGTLLVLLRPSRVTWAWFLLSLWFGTNMVYSRGGTFWAAFSFLPPSIHVVVAEAFHLLQPAAYLALLVVAISFPERRPQGVAKVVDRAVPFIFAFVGVMYLAYDLVQLHCFCAPRLLDRTITVIDIIIPIVALAFALFSYLRARGLERQKLQWIAAATAVALIPYAWWYAVQFAFNHERTIASGFATWYTWLNLREGLILLYIAPSIAMTYTVLKHRVYDIRFVIRRAIVLAIFTSIFVLIFALLDWIFVRRLDQIQIMGLGLGVLGATAIGFTSNALHRRVDTIVDRLIFRRRHLAEEQIAELHRELASASTTSALNSILIKGPVEALNLASAALFTRSDGRWFSREAAIGWPPEALRRLNVDSPPLSPCCVASQARRIPWYDPVFTKFPSPDAYPSVVLPIRAGDELQSIVLYGPHKDGVDLDPDEIRTINGLMLPAAAAYEHLRVAELYRDNERLREELERLATRQT